MAEQENSKDLISVLWSGADILRSKMDANEYKDYLLGIVFYKYLSDSFLIKVYDMICDGKPDTLKEALDVYSEELNGEDAEELRMAMKDECHYVIEPELTYTYFADSARNNSFNREQLQKGFNNIEQSDPIFADLFTDIDLYSNRLGTGDQKQSDTISSLIKEIDKADLLNSDAEILGNAYEYLIGQFASETGKKAGEFYTPQAVSKILTKIAIAGQESKRGLSVYDPCMGSGSLLLNAKKYAEQPDYIKYYGQELNTSTYNLARMNMFLHGIVPDNQNLRNGDTLDGDWPTGEETDFNMVLMNPPYSAKWSAAAGFLQDERFSDYGVLAPKSKADYAFLLHGLYHLKNNGTMAIVLPHGVLFRGAAEGKIREKLLRSGNIYAVIGLPANLFYNTSIPTCIIVLKKHRDGRDVLFIDASKKFNKGKKQNEMTDEHIDAVIELYSKRETVEKESYLATFENIEKNDFNLNIPRYVDNFEKEEDVDINALLSDMAKTDAEITQVQGDFVSLLKELRSPDETIMTSLNELLRKMEG
ncbi:type I restriction-modification system subunit M [uncultured Eubacterium sp.]|uniref:type I restriction-modification system subunit M n=1 Tax=uncultured Eubacterium sp. TaxID=165185 RepID=UPI0025945627|nr:type I restriction-modification system subunit M [uncultured Eubacterium sp.]